MYFPGSRGRAGGLGLPLAALALQGCGGGLGSSAPRVVPPVPETATQGTFRLSATDSDLSITVEATGPILVIGTDDQNRISTGSYNDSVNAGGGADVVNTGAGNDVIRPGGGADEVAAGAGNDAIVVVGLNGDTSVLPTDRSTSYPADRAALAKLVQGGLEQLMAPGNDARDLADRILDVLPIDAGNRFLLNDFDTDEGAAVKQLGGGPGNDILVIFGNVDFSALDVDVVTGMEGILVHSTLRLSAAQLGTLIAQAREVGVMLEISGADAEYAELRLSAAQETVIDTALLDLNDIGLHLGPNVVLSITESAAAGQIKNLRLRGDGTVELRADADGEERSLADFLGEYDSDDNNWSIDGLTLKTAGDFALSVDADAAAQLRNIQDLDGRFVADGPVVIELASLDESREYSIAVRAVEGPDVAAASATIDENMRDPIVGRLVALSGAVQRWGIAGTPATEVSEISVRGDYGDLQLRTGTGEWTYRLRLDPNAPLGLDFGVPRLERFVIRAQDAEGDLGLAPLEIGVIGVNDVPITSGTLVFSLGRSDIRELGTEIFTATDADPGDGPAELTWQLAQAPRNGWLALDDALTTEISSFTQQQLAEGKINYVHGGAAVGSDTFSLLVRDDGAPPAESLEIDVGVAVTGIGSPPTEVLASAPLPLTEGLTARTRIATITVVDPDGGLPGLALVGLDAELFELNEEQTELFIKAGQTLIHDPARTLQVRVQVSESPRVGVSLQVEVRNVNDPPVIRNSALTTPEGSTHVLTGDDLLVDDLDFDDGPTQLTFTLHSLPQYGRLQRRSDIIDSWVDLSDGGFFTQQDINAGLVRYVHGGGEESQDDFMVQAVDDAFPVPAQSIVVTVTLTIEPVDDLPTEVLLTGGNGFVAAGSTSASTPVAFLEIADIDGGPPMLELAGADADLFQFDDATAPTVLLFRFGGNIAKAEGDSVRVRVQVRENPSIGDDIVLTVSSQNEQPTIVNQAFAVGEAETLVLSAEDLLALDPDVSDGAEQLQYILVTSPQYGVLQLLESTPDDGLQWRDIAATGTFIQGQINRGLIRYVHAGGEEPRDSFRVKVADDDNASTSGATVVIEIEAVDDVPTDLRLVGGKVRIASDAFADEATVALDIAGIELTDVDGGPVVLDLIGLESFALDDPFDPTTLRLRAVRLVEGDTLNVRVQLRDMPQIGADLSLAVVGSGENAPPYVVNRLITVVQDGETIAKVLDVNDLQALDPDVTDSSEDLIITLDTLPQRGVLQRLEALVWSDLDSGDTFIQQDIHDGEIRYVWDTDSDAADSPSDYFQITVEDNDGAQTESLVVTATIVRADRLPPTSVELIAVVEEIDSTVDTERILVANLVIIDPDGGPPNLILVGPDAALFEFDDGDNPGSVYLKAGQSVEGLFSLAIQVEVRGSSPKVEARLPLEVTGMNVAPVIRNAAFFVLSGQTRVLAMADLLVFDANPSDGPAQLTIELQEVPSNGDLQVRIGSAGTDEDWRTLAAEETFTQEDINAGRIRYVHTSDDASIDTDSFVIQAQDDQGAQTRVGTVGVSVVAEDDVRDVEDLPDILERPEDQVPTVPGEPVILEGNTLVGTEAGETLDGTEMDDALIGRGGDDVLNGRGGEDVLRGGPGADELNGGEGNDWANYSSLAGEVHTVGVSLVLPDGNNRATVRDPFDNTDTLSSIENVFGSDMNDTLTGNSEANTLRGLRGLDRLSGLEGDDVLIGDEGNDILQGGSGDDHLIGGEGADNLDGGEDESGEDLDYADYSAFAAGVRVDLNPSGTNNVFDSLTGIEGIIGSNVGGDRLIGDDQPNVLRGNGGLDVLHGGKGDDLLYGGSENDDLQGGEDDDNLFGGAGVDSLQGGTGNDRLFGGEGADTLIGGEDADGEDEDWGFFDESTVGLTLDLTLIEDGFNVVTAAGAATDKLKEIENIVGSDHADVLRGDVGRNVLQAGKGNDIINGDPDGEMGGNDALFGGDGDDTLDGGAGDDILTGGANADVLDGGEGIDTAYYTGSAAAVTVTLAVSDGTEFTGTGSGGDAVEDKLKNIEGVVGSEHDDVLTGDDNANLLHGGDGSDMLEGGGDADNLNGGAAEDTLIGGDGNDILIGGKDSDVLDGGKEFDRVFYSDAEAGVTIDLSVVDSQEYTSGIGSDADGDMLKSVEGIIGSAHQDVLTGNDEFNQFQGEDGADTLSGGKGDDYLVGGKGEDKLDGGEGSDNLFGDEGVDSLVGGKGDDRLLGGADEDVLDGGEDSDIASYRDSGDPSDTDVAGVIIDLSQSDDAGRVTGRGGDAEDDILISIEGLVGSNLSDSLTGDDAANQLVGMTGRDVLKGGKGEDNLFGGEGADTLMAGEDNDNLSGGEGVDILEGGEGFDLAIYVGEEDGVSIDLSAANADGYVTGSGGNAEGDRLKGIEAVAGSMGKDVLVGDEGANRLDGNEDADTLTGGGDSDVLIGGAGADTLIGDLGSSASEEVEGFDSIVYSGSDAGVTIDLSATNNNFVTGIGGDAEGDLIREVEAIQGSQFDDALTGNNDTNSLRGFDGDDTISGLGGDDFLFGDTGADTYDGGAHGSGGDSLNYTGSEDGITLDLSLLSTDEYSLGRGGDAEGDRVKGVENVTATAGDDTLTGNDSDNLLVGGEGNDTLAGGMGNDRLSGGSGSDDLDGGEGFDFTEYTQSSDGIVIDLSGAPDADGYIIATGGDADGDRLRGIEGLQGGKGADTLTGEDGTNFLLGFGGADTLVGGEENDTLVGGQDGDMLDGGEGDRDSTQYGASDEGVTVELDGSPDGTVFINATGGDATGDRLKNIEYISGSDHPDRLVGNDLNNQLLGFGGDDTISGGDGADEISGGTGVDKLDGGAGFDRLIYSSSAAGVTIDLSEQNPDPDAFIVASGGDAEGDLYRNFEHVTGSNAADGDDFIAGNDSLNVLIGGGGDDDIFGGGSTDVLSGGNGRDTLSGEEGSDTMIGGDGDDILNGGASDDWALYDYISDSMIGVTLDLGVSEFVSVGNRLASEPIVETDTLRGVENIRGSIGSDTLTGDGTRNQLLGDRGADTLDGSDGNDILNGGAGDDTLIGGKGTDQLVGGEDKDVFAYNSDDIGVARDVIIDFKAGEDKIDLSEVTSLSISFIGTASFSNPLGQLRYRIEGTNVVLELSTNADANVELTIQLGGVSFIGADDFIL